MVFRADSEYGTFGASFETSILAKNAFFERTLRKSEKSVFQTKFLRAAARAEVSGQLGCPLSAPAGGGPADANRKFSSGAWRRAKILLGAGCFRQGLHP